ncbi:arsenite methyltransferase [Flavihumibacter sp. CACIAM 22H1]|uniref:arsenite methyltransferase n=1 Tax=Flavihumibacter sp. CACIAM 22H1 TaxID=1812911 RepID=UPI0007A91D77|nr:arsenite methyltransferase [Flavihumibacter sp. CACIAM 22H1]KYP13730.1 MAG: arsenite S-adenosylmethyltransferase [Flavihumibacter sp. CACIAM 22H1]
MQNDQELKALVREKYSVIAEQSTAQNASSCCGATASCCGTDVYSIMSDDYTQQQGYMEEADLGLGCGLPTAFAQIKEGNTVIDLGSGAGNDCFVARSIVGEKGKVIGIDFTEKMIEKARANAEKMGFNNVEFRQGDIEQMPVTSNVADVIVSNCVLNLVPNKPAVFKEIFRVLKPGAHFSISDIVLEGEIPEHWKKIAELYAGCVSGAIQQAEYLGLISATGFKNIQVQKEKLITLPDEILRNYLSEAEITDYKTGRVAIKSITVYAEKPAACCEPGAGCC